MCDLASMARRLRVLLFAMALAAGSQVVQAQAWSTPVDSSQEQPDRAKPAHSPAVPLPPSIELRVPQEQVVLPPIELQKSVAEAGVDEKLGQVIPADALFTDENGKTVRLGEYFQPGRPVLLQLGYYQCPMLCSLVTRGIEQSLAGMKDLTLGQDFQVIFVSIDPRERAAEATARKDQFLDSLPRGDGKSGSHFLTGSAGSIAALTDAAGFRYKWIESASQYSHPAVAIVLTGDGKVSHYLYGVSYPVEELASSLRAASDGKLTESSVSEPLILTCLHAIGGGGHGALARGLMRVAGALTLIILGMVLLRAWLRRDPGGDVSGDAKAPAEHQPEIAGKH